MAQTKGGSSHRKRSGLKVDLPPQSRLKVGLPTSNDLIKKTSIGVSGCLGLKLIPHPPLYSRAS